MSPAGRYTILDADGSPAGSEDFRSAPGPAGWRYFATVAAAGGPALVDLAVDAAWRPVRVRIESEAGRTLLNASPQGHLRGVLGDAPGEVPLGERLLHYPSPGFLVAIMRAPDRGTSLDVTALDPDTWRLAEERWAVERSDDEALDTPVGRFVAERWTIETRSWRRVVWLAGDMVAAEEGRLELADFEPGPAGPRPMT